MMSAFGSRKPRAIAGSAGRPLRLQTVVRANVAPSPTVIPSQVQDGRRFQRTLAPEEEREEHHVRQPEPGGAPAGHDERDRQLA